MLGSGCDKEYAGNERNVASTANEMLQQSQVGSTGALKQQHATPDMLSRSIEVLAEKNYLETRGSRLLSTVDYHARFSGCPKIDVYNRSRAGASSHVHVLQEPFRHIHSTRVQLASVI